MKQSILWAVNGNRATEKIAVW